jgi:hypothetical protein
MAAPAEHQHQVFAGTAHLPSRPLPLRAAARRYVGLLTDTYPPLPLAARDSQGAEATALHPISTERDDHEYPDRPARAV